MAKLRDQKTPGKSARVGLAPISNVDAQILILGSFPGIASLDAQQYYRHPRNAFWRICADALNYSQSLSYAEQCALLLKNNIAIWDVLSSCHRKGSLDSAIEISTAQCNDLANFFHTHSKIQRVLFNGCAARRFFDRFALPALPKNCAPQLLTMPSTSPAFAAMQFEQKSAIWRLALRDSR